jgi:hypothetical protein
MRRICVIGDFWMVLELRLEFQCLIVNEAQ